MRLLQCIHPPIVHLLSSYFHGNGPGPGRAGSPHTLTSGLTSERVLTYAWFRAGPEPGHAWVPGLHLSWMGAVGGSIAAAAPPAPAVMVQVHPRPPHAG